MTSIFIHSRFIRSPKKKRMGMDGDALNCIPHPFRSRIAWNGLERMGTDGNGWWLVSYFHQQRNEILSNI